MQIHSYVGELKNKGIFFELSTAKRELGLLDSRGEWIDLSLVGIDVYKELMRLFRKFGPLRKRKLVLNKIYSY